MSRARRSAEERQGAGTRTMPGAGRIALGGLAAVGVAYGFARYGYGLFLPALREEFGLSTEVLGLIASASYAGYLGALLLSGFAAARYGARLPVVTGGLLAAAGMGLIAVTTDTAWLVAGVVVAGTSAGCSWAPFSDVVEHTVPPPLRRRTFAAISTGTTFGLIVAAPVALVARDAWRAAWAVFAVVALCVALYNSATLPRRPAAGVTAALSQLSLRWFAAPGAGTLVGITLAQSTAGAVYWTYAVDLAHAHGLTGVGGPLLWGIVGAAGISGVVAGDASGRFGLRRCLVAGHVVLAAGIASLALAPGAVAGVVASAVLFGIGYMGLAALIVILSSRVYAALPSIGFSGTMLVMAAGAIVGPAAAGLVAGSVGLRAAFAVSAAVALAGVVPAVAGAGGRGQPAPTRA